MAFAVKYRCETSDIKGVKWTADILEDGFSGAITYLTGTGSPLVFDFDNGSDDVFDPIRPSSVSINVWSLTNFALQDIYSIELLQFKVNIYADTVLYWTGWIAPQQYKEGYDQPPYRVTLTAIDGLSLLGNEEYINGYQYYTGKRYESQIILDCLDKIGFTEFKEYVNLYEDNIDRTADDSPFDQILADSYVFREYSCYETLSQVLKKYNAFIRQKDGIFCIIRPKELSGSTVNGRYFTAYNTKTSVTLTPLQYINRSSYTSNRRQVPGGQLMVQPPVKQVTLLQDYGNMESWLLNHDFPADEYPNYDGDCFNDWTAFGVPLVSPLEDEFNGCLIPYNTVPDSNYIYQSCGPYASVSTDDNFILAFDYMFHNSLGTTRADVELRIIIKADGSNYWLKEKSSLNGECEWSGTSAYISVKADATPGSTGWINWKRTFVGLPAVGGYTVSIFPLYYSSSDIYLGIKDVLLYTSSVEISKVATAVVPKTKFKLFDFGKAERMATALGHNITWQTVTEYITIKQHEYNATNNINGIYRSGNYLLGDVVVDIDNVPSQFAGALVMNAGSTALKVDTVTLYGSSGTINIISGGYTAEAEFNTTLTQTATDFVTTHAAAFASATGIIVTSSGADIIFTAPSAGFDFSTWTEELTGNLMGVVDSGLPYAATFSATSAWSSGAGGSGGESLSILQLIANEIAAMYNRPKQLIQMPIYETAKALQMNLLGNISDPVNLYNGAMRVFSINRGTFDVRNRKWELDLFEIGTGAVPDGGTSATADSTLITADSTLITSDSTI